LVRARIGARQDADRLLLRTPPSPIFAPLAALLERLPGERWPTHEELTALARGVTTSRGVPLRFVPPRDHTDRERRYYELRIAQSGEVETRRENWHDLFNALVWIAFPRAKATINAQHAAILEEGGEAESRHRGPARDALTVFDEGGVIVATSDATIRSLIVDFQWKELFWRRRAQLEAGVRFFAFGHALYEKGLDPYIGMVAKTVFVDFVADAAGADRLLAAHFADRSRFASPKAMAPMPVLGVPGWHPDTARESFYDDARHFRGKTAPAA
jgi:hypothetical protein